MLSLAIVGLPNVGKSTLFNTLTKSMSAEASNYPFCTIDPNIGVVKVPDERLKQLTTLIQPEKVTPAIVEFVDVAGLVKGASQGEGLGNKFLANIRETNGMIHIVRVFDDPNVIHVNGKVDPKDDIDTINTELIIADIDALAKREGNVEKDAKRGNKEAVKLLEVIKKIKPALERGELANTVSLDEEEQLLAKDLFLLTQKPIIYVANISEEAIRTLDMRAIAQDLGVPEVIPICAKIEAEVAQLSDEEATVFLAEYGLKESGLHRLIRTGYQILGLQTYLTAGVQEVRAWTVRVGATAPQAAGVIHTDFEKGFIKAEIATFEDFMACGGWAGVKEKGKMRLEGRDYVMKDGDVVFFHFNV